MIAAAGTQPSKRELATRFVVSQAVTYRDPRTGERTPAVVVRRWRRALGLAFPSRRNAMKYVLYVSNPRHVFAVPGLEPREGQGEGGPA